MNEIALMKNTIPEYKNPSLGIATRKLCELSENIRRASLYTASIIAAVENAQMWNQDYKSGAEWGEVMFGLKKSQYNNLKRVGEVFVTTVTAPDGKRAYCTELIHEDGSDYNMTQLIRLLPLGLDKARDLDERGVIAPYMSVRQMMEAIKEDEAKAEAETEAEAEAEAAETEAAEAEAAETEAEAEDARRGYNARINYEEKYVVIMTESGEAYRFSVNEWIKHMEVKNEG